MRTLVVSHDVTDPESSKLRSTLRNLVDNQGPACGTFANPEQLVSQFQPELIVVNIGPDSERALEAIHRLRRATNCPLVAVGAVNDPKVILRALHQGADHFIDEVELETGLQAALKRMKIKKEEAAPPAGRFVVVLATSGGCGASTVAVNLAAVFAKENQTCALLDLKAGRGDQAALLDVKPAFNLADLCLNVSRVDRAIFDKMVVQHASGIHLLAAPRAFGDIRVVTPEGVGQAIAMALSHYTFVVADLEDCFHEEQLVALRQATCIILVSRLDFTSLRNTRQILEHFDELDVPRARVRIVINRFGQPNELPVAEAEEALGDKLAHFIPDDSKTINGANNAGIPAVIKAPGSKVAQSIMRLAKVTVERRHGTAADQQVPTLR
jgi:pilus assembly protein CpaE